MNVRIVAATHRDLPCKEAKALWVDPFEKTCLTGRRVAAVSRGAG